jgi:hypothetical protein
VTTWDGALEEVRETPQEATAPAADGPDATDGWAANLRVHLHPNSVHALSTAQHLVDDTHASGLRLGTYFADTFDESGRFFLEECDYLQGYQVFLDAHDGFGGFGVRALETLRDEIPKVNILAFPVIPPTTVAVPGTTERPSALTATLHAVNVARTMHSLGELASLVVPLSFTGWRPNAPAAPEVAGLNTVLTYDIARVHETSAVLAAAVDAATTGLRAKPHAAAAGGQRVPALVGGFNTGTKRNLAALAAHWLPECAGDVGTQYFSTWLHGCERSPLLPRMAATFCPTLAIRSPALRASVAVRGINGPGTVGIFRVNAHCARILFAEKHLKPSPEVLRSHGAAMASQ